MQATLLLIITIVLSKHFTQGFVRLNPQLFNSGLVPFTKTKVRLITTTIYDDDEDWNNKRKRKYSSDFDSDFDSYFINDEGGENHDTFYTLIWFDCEDCIQLLKDVKKHGKKILYINGSYYFFDENDETNVPIFYKNNDLIATDLFSIYEELFLVKIIEK